jgi:MerR family transcriptional regulator, redox-sensitive transcriptional activator SoxR
MEMLTIGDVAQEIGIQTSAVRYYESIGLIPAPERVSGQRRYTADILVRLRMIRAAQEMGFSLDEIKLLLDGFSVDTPPSARWQMMAHDKLPEIEALIARATAMKALLKAGLECQCISIEDCFRSGCDSASKDTSSPHNHHDADQSNGSADEVITVGLPVIDFPGPQDR